MPSAPGTQSRPARNEGSNVEFQSVSRLAPADETGLIRNDLHKHPVSHPGMADERFGGGDFHGCRVAFLNCEMETDELLWRDGLGFKTAGD